MRIAIAGSSGVVGTHAVRHAVEAGHDVVALARRPHPSHVPPEGCTGTYTPLVVDLLTGEGLDLTGVDAVIDVSGMPKLSGSEQYFGTATGHLLRESAAAGVQNVVPLSIVGAAASPYGYYAGKALQERLVREGPVPWTILRATQFFEFAVGRSVTLGPWSLVAKMRSQPVSADSVGRRLVELAVGRPAGLVPDFAGPDQLWLAELARMVFETHGLRRAVIEIPLPGKFGRAVRSAAILPGGDAQIDGVSYEHWLAAGAPIPPGAV